MRLTLLIVIITVFGLVTTAQAADGFGSYFSNQAPAGLTDTVVPNAFAENQTEQTPSVADIEPAAGDEQTQIVTEQPSAISGDVSDAEQMKQDMKSSIEDANTQIESALE